MNSFCRIAAIGGLSCAIAGFAPAAIGVEGPADKSASPGRGWYVGTGVPSDRPSGFGILLGAGYAFQVARGHNITFTVDYSRQSYSGSSTKPDSSEFTAAYLGYMYRR